MKQRIDSDGTTVAMNSLVTVATFDNLPKAEMARILLKQEGLVAVLTDGNMVATDWLLSNAIGGIKLQVASEDADRALFILNEHLFAKDAEKTDQPGTLRFRCSECDSVIEFANCRAGGVEVCPKCKNYIDVPETSDTELPAQAESTSSVRPTLWRVLSSIWRR